ncbi:MAG TPA: Type 1 glutamine amidotransferase-like domain-containing protein [Ilumatobacter sp.]|nr:Type 1 glutamine amidotransferase-like domain-containing protein [Ilumatobacter sp.]
MDADLLRRVSVAGPVVVTALAGAPGGEYRTAGENGLRHFRDLGAVEAVVAPDVREEPVEALAVLREAGLLVLPGGSPSRLHQVLLTTPVGDVVRERVAAGAVVMGSSAGAMVLCDWTVLPDRRGPAGPAVVRGLGVVPGLLVVPHWSGGSSRADWLRAITHAVPPDVQVLGLPEQSGVLVAEGEVTAVGSSPSVLVTDGCPLPLGQTWRRP